MSRPPKIVIPGLNRGNGIAGGYIVGRQKGKGPAELLSLNALRRMGVATKAGATQSTSLAISTANSLTVSLSTGISTVISGSISSVISKVDSLSTAVGGGGGTSTSLSQISSSLSGAISSTTSLSTAVSTVDSNQSTSLSQISSSLSSEISTDLSRINSLSTAEIAAIAAASGSGGTIPDGVVSGCGVFYSGSGLTFNMSAGTVYIDNTLITAAAQSVTLAAADATNPRIDTLYVDSSGVFGKITGTPAADPSQPAVDPTTQLYLTFVLVPALATTITGITNEDIYREGTEWTGTTSGSGFTVGSTNNPFAGTKDVEGTTVAAAAYVKFVRSSAMSFDGAGNLTFEIRSKAAWNTKRWLTFQWYLAGVAKGAAVSLKSGTFGFDSSITSGYQLIVIPKTQFAVPAGTNIDQLRVVDVGGSIGFYLDEIILQNTGTSTGGGGSGGITQAQADARYLLLTVGSTSLSQISSSLSGTNSTNVTQSTSLSQISSSLSGAISSTSSLSTAVSTVISGSISAANSRIDSLSTAVGTGGGPDPGQSTSLSQISSSLSGAISSTSSLSTAVSTVDSNQSTSLSQISSSLSGAISSTSSLSTAVSTVDSNQSTSLSQISSSLSGAISSTSSLSTAVSTVDSNQSTSLSQISSSLSGALSTAAGGGGGIQVWDAFTHDLAANTGATGSRGGIITPVNNCTINALMFRFTPEVAATLGYDAQIVTLDGSATTPTVLTIVATKNLTPAGVVNQQYTFTFASPVALTAGTRYGILLTRRTVSGASAFAMSGTSVGGVMMSTGASYIDSFIRAAVNQCTVGQVYTLGANSYWWGALVG